VQVIKFSRNFGHQIAISAGIDHARGDCVVIIDADLQDPPEVVADMVAQWRRGFDVVYGVRSDRAGETRLKLATASMFYRLMGRVTNIEIPANVGDFRLMSRRVVDEVLRLKEHHGFLRGLVALVGFRQTSVLFDRPERFAGSGHYNRLIGSLRIGLNGVICFSTYLLTLSSTMGFLIAGISFVIGVVYAVMKILGTPFPLGNPTIVILILFMGGVQLISVGVLGEYIARIYDEVKQRPKFIIEDVHGLDRVTAEARARNHVDASS